MNTITKLSDQLIAKVAAGEVVQEPSNVIKELIENALDAQATEITVHIENAGLTSITVIDNGHGMTPEDLRLSWLHHTTSKIRDPHDLLQISSFGFRGEALSSIAAVADVTLRSRPPESDKGHEIQIQKQKIVSDQPVGCAPGTQITVQHLFQDVPGRKQSTFKPRTILKNIQRSLLHHALAHTNVRFELRADNKLLLLLPNTQTIEERIAHLLGEDSQPHLLPLYWESDHLTIHGYIGKPQLARRNKHHQYVAINRRPVKYPQLAESIRQTFSTLLEPHLHPSFVLFIETNADLVDPNVHPRKETVRLLLSEAWFEELHQVITTTFTQHDIAYKHGENWSVADSSPQTVEGKTLKNVVDAWQVRPPQHNEDILQIHNLYLIMPTENGVMMIDQHAAHERILYEQFVAGWKADLAAKKSVTLETPITLNLSIDDQSLLETHLENLQQFGFAIEHFHERKWIVSAVPELYADRDVAVLLRQVLDDLEQGPLGKSIHPNQHRLLAYLACRTAIKAGELLTLEERKKLIERLENTTTQYTCPHGRPVMVELSLDELDRLFKRK
ncbi:DNA mismatch repair endonuclease MutL [Candidatus Woesebacteria bacterium]|nr:DNA mismatch repair endonuclease MutL [Candidatus Woesebacteria bacterium]MCD8527029.1 DNA mismatch repair endonuclease MutL [Candidatus Woesebacteria bacterium]MCD8545908.1 DNA mismatch repair endonuclease MutL [Candidatus Woesebacteria bacterium]